MRPIFTILSFTKSFWRWYVMMGVFVVAISALSLAVPLLSKEVVDLIVAKLQGDVRPFSLIIRLLIFIIVVDVGITFLTAISQYLGDILGVRLQTYLMGRFYEHVLALHVGYYDQEVTGRIVNKMYRGITSISDFVQNMLNNFLPFFLTAFVTIFLLAQYSLVIAVLLAVLFPLYIGISHGSSLAWRKFEEKKNVIHDASQGRVFEALAGIRIVRSFATELLELKAFLSARKQIENTAIRQSQGWHWYDLLRRLCLNVVLFAIFAYIVYWTFEGRFTLGEMTLLLQLVNQARFPLFAMSFILGQVQQASAGSKDFFTVLSETPQIQDAPRASLLKQTKHVKHKEVIRFENVGFSYDSNRDVLRNVSFAINQGEKLALVGESGQGKSTIVNLLLRYYQPTQGSIQVYGQDVSQLQQQSLREQIAVVFQEALLFSGSILENIRYGKPDATQAQVEAVAKAANAHDFILELPKKYDTEVGERGVKLSGGQKQRIAIARAMLKNAPIIVLDEATSALDSKAEREVQKGLDHLLAGRTSIIIAHRLSTVAQADQVLVLAGGTVAERGSAATLLRKKSGLYAELVRLQRAMLRTPKAGEPNTRLAQFDLVG